MILEKPAYIPLAVAARKCGLSEAELRARCECPTDFDAHGGEIAPGQYYVLAMTVERLTKHAPIGGIGV